MAAILTALHLLTSRDGSLYIQARARSTLTGLATLTKGAGTIHTLWMTPQIPGPTSDLQVVRLVLPVGVWTIETCRMKSLSVPHPVLPGFHLRGTLALQPRVGLIPRRHPPFAPPESDQNLPHGLASIPNRLCDPLLTLAPALRNLLCNRRFIGVTL